MFILYANKTQMAVLRREPVTSGSVNVYQVKFTFSADCEGMTKTAVFRAGDVSRSVPLEASGVCEVPWEVLTSRPPRRTGSPGRAGTARRGKRRAAGLLSHPRRV